LITQGTNIIFIINRNLQPEMSDTSASTVETTLQIALANTRTIAYCLFVCLPALPMGFDASMLLALPQFREKFGYEYQGDYVVSATHQAIWNIVAVPGGFLGAVLAGPIGDRLGRRYIFIIGSVVFIAGTVQLQFSSEWKLMATGKFFSYTGIFMYLVAVPTYISEIAPLGIRGVMLTLVNLFSFVGGLISSCILQGTQHIPSNLSFRIPIILQYIVPFILLTCTWFIPESPPWLVENGKIELAKAALKQLRGKHFIDQHLHEIEKTISQEQKKASAITYIECFKGSNLRRTMIAVSILFAAQQVGMVFAYGYVSHMHALRVQAP
jgi:SP family general alpha glucoside:H+ symporter-like MFS transporter